MVNTKQLDWGNIGFAYHVTDKRFVAHYKDGKWDEGGLTDDATIHISESAGIMQYCQQVFEGCKAYTQVNGDIVVFRPDMNAKRMIDGAKRLVMPPVPEELFLKAIDEVVKANIEWVPPYGSGATLYIRPFLFASSPVIGVKPAEEYEFRVFTTPVGPYYKDGVKPMTLCVSDFDRAAPNGTGNIKAGLNYAMSLHAHEVCHANGFDENLFVDAATRTYIEETGGANAILITKDKEVVIPQSNSILPSITRRSVVEVAEKYHGLKVTNRPVKLTELDDMAEMGVCGTAAVISPVGRVVSHDKVYELPCGMKEMGPTIKELYDTLTGIQQGTVEAPEGWIHKIANIND